MSTPSLNEFVESVPVCEQTSGLATVLEIFRSSGCDAIVVISEQQRPLGVIHLRQVVPYLISLTGLGESSVAMASGELHKPLSQLEPPIVDPLIILPAQLSLSQFWSHLQESGEGLNDGKPGVLKKHAKPSTWLNGRTSSPPYCALIDEDGKFLGQLNHWLLLQSLTPQVIATEAAGVEEEPQPTGIEVLMQLLEQLPLPLSLQTATGQVLIENLAWRQQIAIPPSPDALERTATTGSAAPGAGTKSRQIPDRQRQQRSHRGIGSSNTIQPSPFGCATHAKPGKASTRTDSPNWQKDGNGNGASANQAERTPVPLDREELALAALGKSGERDTTGRRYAAAKKPAVATLGAPVTQALTRSTLCSSPLSNSPVKPLTRQPTQSPKQSFAVEHAVKERDEFPAQRTNQQHCALDAPPTEAQVSQRRASLPALPVLVQDAVAYREASGVVSDVGKPNQERIFSFIRIPLSASVVLQESEETDTGTRGRGDAGNFPMDSFASSSPHSSDVWLVFAQDTTEQQQVAKELAAKNADLVQLNRLKDEFLACISHELKTPLTAILGLSSLLKDQTLGKLNERQARYARLIYQSGRQLMTIVNDILDLTRMETGQLELTLEPVQLQSVCDRAYSQALQRPSEKDQQEDESSLDIPFNLEIEPGLETIVADELRLRQMLVHLLSNALKFTDASGKIGLKVNRWEDWIAFTVWDTGIGIPEEKQHLIFQKFQQLENPLTRRFEGAGLGLALTQRLARLHGGDVSFISKIGEGSKFTVVLPPCPPPEMVQKLKDEGAIDDIQLANLQPATPASRNRLVLIVETVPQYVDDLTEQLNRLDYHVVIARSGTEAIEKARSLQPCAILLNPLLPQLSGWDVLTLLKSDVQTLHIPIFVTATQAEKQQAYHNKANGFLSLPVQEQALLQSLNALGKPQSQTSKSLTILYLSPELGKTCPNSSVMGSELTDVMSHQLSELNYRVLEADDLEQAELLAHVWRPDVILLDSEGLADPFAYFKQFSLHGSLTALPLVTLDRQTAEAANQVAGLAVYPCLAPDNQQKMASLLQVIQVAAGIGPQSSNL
ncbi:MAG: response regulator [Coleofasciculus sp. S288]|nr:response regulator [Coleofasciculus sp. S288]